MTGMLVLVLNNSKENVILRGAFLIILQPPSYFVINYHSEQYERISGKKY